MIATKLLQGSFPRMTLHDLVEKYLAIAGGFAFLAPLADFGLERAEAERIFGAFDEDYHISRYLHFSQVSGSAYKINGFEQTHLSIDGDIQSIL
jgi:hypothetical protein